MTAAVEKSSPSQRHSNSYSSSPARTRPSLANWCSSLEQEGKGVDRTTKNPLAHVLRAVWGMLYADEASYVSRSPVGLSGMMTESWECLRPLAWPCGREEK